METTLTLNDFLALAALMLPLYGAIFLHHRALRAEMNQRFSDARTSVDRRFDDAQKANDTAHANIGENIRSLERRVDTGLSNVHVQLAAITPRAAAEQPGQNDQE